MNTELMDVLSVSQYIGVKVNTVYAWVNSRKIPHIKLGRLLKFNRNEIDTWVQSKKVEVYKS
jgi:excisionase family DNA binding protein